MSKIKWKSQETLEQERLEQEQQRLAEEQKKQAIENAPSRIAELEAENMNLMIATAEVYENAAAESMALMTALADVYEELQTLKGGS